MVEAGNLESAFASHKQLAASSPLPTDDMLLKVDQLNDEIKLLLEKYSSDNVLSSMTNTPHPLQPANNPSLEAERRLEGRELPGRTHRLISDHSEELDAPRRFDDSGEFGNLDDIYGHPPDLKHMLDRSGNFAHSPAKLDLEDSAIHEDHESPLEMSHHPVLQLLQSKTEEKHQAFESTKRTVIGKCFDPNPRQPAEDRSFNHALSPELGVEASELKNAQEDASFLSKMKKLLSDTRRDIDQLEESFAKPPLDPPASWANPGVTGKATPAFISLADTQPTAAKLPQAVNVKSVLASKHSSDKPKAAASSRQLTQQSPAVASYYDRLPASRASRPAPDAQSQLEDDEESFCLRKHLNK